MTPAPTADPALLDFAVEVATEAGSGTLRWFQDAALTIDEKTDGTPVTVADLEAETLVRERIQQRFPDDAVVGEEHGDASGTTGRTWVVDPIDGTKAFTKGVPLFATLLALVDEHGPVVGVIHLPALGETISAGRGLGAFLNGRPCRVSSHASLDGAYICSSGFSYWPPAALDRVLSSPAVFRTWGDAYGYALVATGRAEAMIDPIANPWDLAPIGIIVTEAGGRFTGIDGRTGPDAWRSGSGIGTNGVIHDPIVAWFDDATTR